MSAIKPRHLGGLTDQRETVKENVLRALEGLSDQELCRRLDLLPAGLEVVRERWWSLDYAFEVCVTFGLDWKEMQR